MKALGLCIQLVNDTSSPSLGHIVGCIPNQDQGALDSFQDFLYQYKAIRTSCESLINQLTSQVCQWG